MGLFNLYVKRYSLGNEETEESKQNDMHNVLDAESNGSYTGFMIFTDLQGFNLTRKKSSVAFADV